MWNLLKKSDEECRKVRDLLEDSAAARPQAVSIRELSQALSAAAQTHIGACISCQAAAKDLLATRGVFQGVGSNSEMERPWLAASLRAAHSTRARECGEHGR